LRERTKTGAALNLLILSLYRDNAKPPAIHYLNYFKTEAEGRMAYYQMYSGDMPGGKAVFSSTIADLPVKGLGNVKKAMFDKLLIL